MKSIHIVNLIQIFLYSGMAFFLSFLFFPKFIKLVKELKITQKIRDKAVDGKTAELYKKLHSHKSGTPTMGGIVIIGAVFLTIIISRILNYFGITDYSLLNRGETYLPLFTILSVGGLGIIDDWLNIRESSSQKGLSSKVKFWSLVIFAILGAGWFFFKLEWSMIHIPGVGDFDIGFWYIPLFIFVIVGTSNSVNLTDGLDGLAGGLLAISFGVFAFISYLYGLPILATFCTIIVATLVGFLWFNVPPAKIYMGDTGSLALGATLGVIAMMTNSLFVLIIIGGIFIVETLSVALQIFWKRKFGKKLFLIAPIHHHFEAKGWSETQVVMRFWIIGVILAVIGLSFGVLGMGDKFGII